MRRKNEMRETRQIYKPLCADLIYNRCRTSIICKIVPFSLHSPTRSAHVGLS